MWHHNVDLLAYHDLGGRSGFKLALQEVGGRFFLYVAGFWHSGWSILEVTDPEHPELLRWLDGPPGTMTIQVQVADGTMITALEHPPPGLTIGDAAATPQDGFLIWDVREPDRPQLLGQWVSGGTGTHRNFGSVALSVVTLWADVSRSVMIDVKEPHERCFRRLG
jgi:hypothetical protein